MVNVTDATKKFDIAERVYRNAYLALMLLQFDTCIGGCPNEKIQQATLVSFLWLPFQYKIRH